MATSSPVFTTALQHHQSGRVAEAEQVYKLLLQDQPDYVDALNMLGALVYEDHRYDEALGYFDRVLHLKPGADSLNSVGIVLKAQGKLDEALEHYQQAIELKPDQPEILSNFGNVLKDRGDLEDAIATYQKALELRPNYAEAHNNLGIVYKEQDKMAEAIACYEAAIQLKPTYAEAFNNLGIVLRIQGKLEAAIQQFEQAIALKPTYAEAYTSLASAYQQQGNPEAAIAQYTKLLELKPTNAEAFNNLGLAYQQQGKIEEAMAAYAQALVHRPNYPNVSNNLGNLLLDAGRMDEAIQAYQQAIADRPNYAEAYNNLGNAYQRQSNYEQAVIYYRKALESRPNFVEALSNLGAVLKDQKQLDAAVSCLKQALAIRDDYAEIHNNLGNVYQDQGKIEDAIACYESAVALKPDLAEVHSNLGNMLQYLGNFEAAFEHFHQAIAAQPDFAGAYNNLGIAYRNHGQLDQAFIAYSKAIELDPNFIEAHWNKSLNHLLLGDFQQGFAGYEQRFDWIKFKDQNPQRNYPQPRWDGAPLDGKTILLHAEQGMGDTIQFIRYAPIVANLGGRIILECHPPLFNLLKDLPAIVQLIPYGQPIPPFDTHAPLMSLPYILGTTLETVPAEIPYLQNSDPSALCLLPPALSHPSASCLLPSVLKIGIVWSGNPDNPYNRARTVPLRSLVQLADIPGVALYSLQKDLTASDEDLLKHHPEIQDLRSQLTDFTHTAALIQQLDVIISIDTAVTHLAGALGKPVWLLLPSAADWRWMIDREDTPWYPTMRLFRQSTFGDWEPVIARVETELRQQQEEQQPLSKPNRPSSPISKSHKSTNKKSKNNQPRTPVQPSKQVTQNPKSKIQNLKSPANSLANSPLPEALKQAIRLHQAGKIAEAKSACIALLDHQPIAEGWHLLGIMAHHDRDFEQAIAHYRKTLELKPQHQDTLNNIAVAFHESGNLDEAIVYYKQVLELKPDYADAHNNYANALRERGQLDDAIDHYQQAIAARPEYADAYNNLGLVYFAKSDFEQAAVHYRQAVTLRPAFPQAHNHLGNALKELGRFAEASQHYREAIALKPNYAKAFNNWGNIFRDDGDLQTAVQYYDQATAIEPDFAEAHWNKALTLLLGGDFQRGFVEYEWRKHINLPSFKSLRDFPGPRWDGSPLNGQVIFLHAEQGMGDIIQFIRYIPLVRQLGGQVILECHPPLVPLLKHLPDLEAIIPYGSAPPGYHVQAPLLSLPAILGATVDTIPATVPYLPFPASDVELPDPSASSLQPPAFKIGIVWSGNPENPYNRARAVPLELLLQLAEAPGVELYSLQKDVPAADDPLLQSALQSDQIQDLRSQICDFIDTATLIQQLDLVISIDTAVTHLAGAINKPVWLLLPFAPDWRWMLHRSDSPWYPTIEIFRQPTAGDWQAVLAQVKQALEERQKAEGKEQKAEDKEQKAESTQNSKFKIQNSSLTPSSPTSPSPSLSPTSPSPAEALQLYHSGNVVAAEQLYRQLLQQQPDHTEALNVLSVILLQTQRAAEGVAMLRQLLELQPNFAEGWGNLGGGLQAQGDFVEAATCYEQAIALLPDYPDARQNFSTALLELNRPFDALTQAEQVIKSRPDSADAYYNLGLTLRRCGQLSAAIAAYERAIALQPGMVGAHKNLGHVLLLSGDFARGFAEYEWRWQQDHWTPRAFTQPAWDGSDLQGKTILLYAEQGFGDTLQFIRYATLVHQRGGRVIVECQAALMRLLSQIPAIAQLIPQDSPLPDFDTHASLMSLPRILGTTVETVSAEVPYLKAEGAAKAEGEAVKDEAVKGEERTSISEPAALNIGIVWAGNPNHKNDRFRSCSLEQFRPLFTIPTVGFYSLQKGDPANQLQAEFPVQDWGAQLEDFVDTAAAIAQLDLVITVDTAVAHLAGAMGKPVWVLLAFAPDWRWLQNREDTPWYPTMRLFRQTQPGDWQPVFGRVADALREKAEGEREKREKRREKAEGKEKAEGEIKAKDGLVGWVEHSETHQKPTHQKPESEADQQVKNQVKNQQSTVNIDSSFCRDWQIITAYLNLESRRNQGFAPLPESPSAVQHLSPLQQALLTSMGKSAESKERADQSKIHWEIWGDRSPFPVPPLPSTLALVALEDTHLDQAAIEHLKEYRAIATGSTWNAEILKSHGLHPIVTRFWNGDPSLFYPQPNRGLSTSRVLGDRFVIFSGGELSYRKGQDLLVAAFKTFQSRHPEALLLNTWGQSSPTAIAELSRSSHCTTPPPIDHSHSLQADAWLLANGLPQTAFLNVGAVPHCQLASILHQADVAVFPSRCEAGTDQALAASLACGIPTILSNNTAHQDLLRQNLAYPLQAQRAIAPLAGRSLSVDHTAQSTAGWGESDIEELLELLEYLYTHRQEASYRAIAAADQVCTWTWQACAAELLSSTP
jgi:tetratricopeptide (TPR) repeat protein/glycosyltransferase involved in cell wall biosynthesis